MYFSEFSYIFIRLQNLLQNMKILIERKHELSNIEGQIYCQQRFLGYRGHPFPFPDQGTIR